MALSFSVAEYGCPVWERAANASHLGAVLHESYRFITVCLKLANTSNHHLFAGIPPPPVYNF